MKERIEKMSIYFIPLFDLMKIPQIKDFPKESFDFVFGFISYHDYHSIYSQISILPNIRIFILEDFCNSIPKDPLLTSLFILHSSFQHILLFHNEKIFYQKKEFYIESFIKNRTIYGKSILNINLELDE